MPREVAEACAAAVLETADDPFVPGRPLGGFRTGELGIGHVALITAHFEQMCHLYKEVLSFKVSDRARAPFRVEFLHVNPRHHTLSIAHTGGPAKIYHMMLEYNDFDDLRRASATTCNRASPSCSPRRASRAWRCSRCPRRRCASCPSRPC